MGSTPGGKRSREPRELGSAGRLPMVRSGGSSRGLFVDFFGRPASTHKAIALLAIEHKTPIVVGVARRLGDTFQYEIRCEEIIDPTEMSGSTDDVRLLTQRYTSALERLIREHPEQYFWLHRRWKHQPKPREKKRKPGQLPASAPAESEATPA